MSGILINLIIQAIGGAIGGNATGAVTGGAFPRKVGGENRTVTAGRRPWWPRMAGLQPLSTRACGPARFGGLRR